MKSRGRPPKYPWDEWFKKPSFTLRPRQHYSGSASHMSQQVRNAASVRRISVSLEEKAGTIRVTVHHSTKGKPHANRR